MPAARPRDGRLIAGVSAAVSEQLTVDVTLVRLAFFLLGFAWGIGALVYVLLWVLIPDEEQASSVEDFRSVARTNIAGIRDDLRRSRARLSDAWRRDDAFPWPRPLDRRWVAMALVAVGALILLVSIGAFDWLTGPRAVGLAVIALGAGVLISMRR